MNQDINDQDATYDIQTDETPQWSPIPGKVMSENNAGGFSFELDPWKRLDRFLILGTEKGTYYVSEEALTRQNTDHIQGLLRQDGLRFVQVTVDCLNSGRAPKPNPAIYCLALAAAKGDEPTRKAALAAVPYLLRTGTQLLGFVHHANELRGWGRGLKRAVQLWLKTRPHDTLALQLLKYKQREGWAMRDVLRLARPVPADEIQAKLFGWVMSPSKQAWSLSDVPPTDKGVDMVWASSRAHRLCEKNAPVGELTDLIIRYRLPRESLPSQALTKPEIWESLLQVMPMTALIRNLGTMSKVGLLKPHSVAEALVISHLTDANRLRKARVHPIQVLSALNTYASGSGKRSSARWNPCPRVVAALDAAFELSFAAVERQLLALDVSGSMGCGEIAGVPGLTPAAASAALAVTAARTEPWTAIMGFADTFRDLGISARDRVDEVVNKTRDLAFGCTDCSVPMTWALEHRVPVDTFVVYTDSETYAGEIHPSQALKKYRDAMGIHARLIVVGMTATEFTIADPDDPGMLDVVGFDATAPELMARFAQGQV